MASRLDDADDPDSGRGAGGASVLPLARDRAGTARLDPRQRGRGALRQRVAAVQRSGPSSRRRDRMAASPTRVPGLSSTRGSADPTRSRRASRRTGAGMGGPGRDARRLAGAIGIDRAAWTRPSSGGTRERGRPRHAAGRGESPYDCYYGDPGAGRAAQPRRARRAPFYAAGWSRARSAPRAARPPTETGVRCGPEATRSKGCTPRATRPRGGSAMPILRQASRWASRWCSA